MAENISYMQELELSLKERLVGVPEDQQTELIRFVKDKVLESYRNGQKTPKRGGKTWRRAASN